MSEPKNPNHERETAIRQWESKEQETLSRKFSGERVKPLVQGDWLGKAVFIGILGIALYFIFTGDTKAEREEKRKVKEVAQMEEPSSRDYKPPVMPTNKTPPTPQPIKAEPAPEFKQEDPEAIAKRQQQEQLQIARLKSGILVKANADGLAKEDPPNPLLNPSSNLTGLSSQLKGNEQNQPGPSDPNRAFARYYSGNQVVRAQPLQLGNQECIALQGKSIDGVLETAINTDLPGQIRAIVSTPLYAEQGREVLIPTGTRINGTYNTSIRKGQARVFAIWNRVQRPDGIGIMIDSPMTDTLGRAGLYGEVDNHYVEIFGISALLSIIGAGASTSGVNDSTQYNSSADYRREVQHSFAKTSQQVLEPYANMPPTIHIKQGTKIKIFLNRDLDFCPLFAEAKEEMKLVLP